MSARESNERADLIAESLGLRVISMDSCAGGDINSAWQLELEDGRQAFFKSRFGAPPGGFRTEAAGLAWLAEPGGLFVPDVLAVIDPPVQSDASADPSRSVLRGLVLEWIEPAGLLDRAGQEAFGRGLARVHMAGAERHGELAPGAVGGEIHFGRAIIPALSPHGSASPAFAEVYAGRIEALAAQALASGAVDRDGASVFASLADGIERYAGPDEPPARLHGDLWSGNVITGPDGEPWLIDPAAHGGHRELDLAMLELFGSPGDAFYGAYAEIFPLDPGREERIPLWQVQPLLVHAILFGGHYGASAVTAARRYTGT